MKVIDNIQQFDSFKMAEFICELTKEIINKAVKETNKQFGADILKLSVDIDRVEIIELLESEVK